MQPSDLLKINVNEHTEKKNGLTYLSWAWAWAEVLKIDPSANYEVEQFPHPDDPRRFLPYQELGGSCMVWVKVMIFGKVVKVQLPVLDYRNKCIPVPNAFEVNTSIMRCLTKGIAMHGLSLYIYAGEDLPMDYVETQPATVAVADRKTGEIIGKVEVNTGEEDANKKLFADGMMEYTSICKDLKGLNSYWKANQEQLDALKVSHPELYAQVRNRFAEMKKQLSESQT